MPLSDLPPDWKEAVKNLLYENLGELSTSDKKILGYIISDPGGNINDICAHLSSLYGSEVKDVKSCVMGYGSTKNWSVSTDVVNCLGKLEKAGIIEIKNDGDIPQDIRLTDVYKLFEKVLMEWLNEPHVTS
jgi:hypothetical protein